jgi:hypothetical protein
MSLFLPFFIFPYIIIAAMPSWRWLAACSLLTGGIIAAAWIQYNADVNSPNYHGSPGDFFAVVILTAAAAGFATAVAVRGFTLWRQSRGMHIGRAITINILGLPVAIALTLGVPLAQHWWQEWQRRPPSDACAASVTPVEVAGATLRLPALPVFNLYPNRSVRDGAYYLATNAGIRTMCSATEDGRRQLHLTNIWIHIEGNRELRTLTCERLPERWRVVWCPALAALTAGHVNDTDLPLRAHVFAPDEVAMGEFGATASTYADSTKAPAPHDGETYLRADRTTPDGHPLTFACRKSAQNVYCRASFAWVNGAHMDYAFNAAEGKEIEKGLRIDAVTRSLFDALLEAR